MDIGYSQREFPGGRGGRTRMVSVHLVSRTTHLVDVHYKVKGETSLRRGKCKNPDVLEYFQEKCWRRVWD